MNSYTDNRRCAEVLEKLLSAQLGSRIRVRVKPDENEAIAANQQAQYGLAEMERRSREAVWA